MPCETELFQIQILKKCSLEHFFFVFGNELHLDRCMEHSLLESLGHPLVAAETLAVLLRRGNKCSRPPLCGTEYAAYIQACVFVMVHELEMLHDFVRIAEIAL